MSRRAALSPDRWLAAAAALVFAGAFGLGAASFGCRSEGDVHPASETRLAEPREVISEPLMLALAQAKNFHHKADVYLEMGDVEAAIGEVRKILAIPFPAGAAEAQDVLLDARARLAKLLLGRGELAAARQVVDEGIAASSRESFFLANLYTVRGELLEAEAHAAGESDATALRRQAIEAYDRAIRINESIQKRLMQELGK